MIDASIVKKKHTFIVITIIMIVFIISGCDWSYYALINSVPIQGEIKKDSTVHVYLGLDGASYYAMKKAMKQGAFQNSFMLSKFICPYPSTSDLGWSRLMHTEKIPSYEYQYYNPLKDTIINSGYPGLLKHVVPAWIQPAYSVFHFSGNGYAHKYYVYRERKLSYSMTLDNLFVALEGVSQTSNIFAGYIAETDTMAHMDKEEDIIELYMLLSKRIESFKKDHPERKYVFTLFSDHGNDFVHVDDQNMIEFDTEMKKAGITPVKSLKDQDDASGLFAIPIIHTRVSYVALYTTDNQAQEISEIISEMPSIDLVTVRGKTEESFKGKKDIAWYDVWSNGNKVSFGFDSQTDEYLLFSDNDYSRYDFVIDFSGVENVERFDDNTLFHLTKHSKYPDFFFRARTSIESIGILYPAQVIASFKHPYASIGFQIPGGANKIASSSFHGAFDDLSSNGILLSEERDLPDAVRLDTLFQLFPRLKKFVVSRNFEVIEGDPNEGIDY